MGVVVQKTSLCRSTKKNKAGLEFIKFKLSDMQRYKAELVHKIQENQLDNIKDPIKQASYRMMRFTSDRYKMIDCILFGEAAVQFSKACKYGYVVALLSPQDIEKENFKPCCLKVKDASKLLIIGKSKDYTVCNGYECNEFLNIRKGGDKCLLHTQKDIELQYQKFKSNRPGLKSNFVDR